jgi:molecular chaperone IbpA
LLGFGRRDVADGLQEPPVVEPVDPFQRRELDGFGADDIAATAEQNALTIEGRKPEEAAGEYLYRGIAARPFRRVFNLADYVQVKEVSFRDGLLIIDLVREVPEAMKPRRIQIGSGASPASQIEQKKAA